MVLSHVKMLFRKFSSSSTRLSSVIKKKWWNDETALAFLERCNLKTKEVLARRREMTTDFETLQTEIRILEESGIAVTCSNLARFRKLFEEDLRVLKLKEVLHDENVADRYRTYLEDFPYDPGLPLPSKAGIEEVYKKIKQYYRRSLQMKERAEDWPKGVALETSKTLEIEQKSVLRQYYVHRLMSDYFTIDKLMYNYAKVTGLRSIRSIKRTLDILERDLEIRPDKIIRNFYLLSIIPERLEDLIKNVKTVGGEDLKTVADAVPKILAKNISQIKEMDELLKEYGIAENKSHFRKQIFTYTPATVRSRLELISKSELSAFLEHPRICELLFYFRKAWDRAKVMESRGIKCMSLNILTANEKTFQSFINDGVDRIHIMRDILHVAAHALGVPREELSPQIGRHPMRHFVPVAEVKSTLEALIEFGFKKELILETITIILYPKDKVFEALDVISKSHELKELNFDGGFTTTVSNRFPSGTKFSDKRLPLCLYLLEKPYHFTGEGATRINKHEDPE